MSERATGNVPRRRRSWYRRRLRIQRALLTGAMVLVIAAVCWQNAARLFSWPTLHVSQVLPDSFSTRVNLRQDLAWNPPHATTRPKYVERVPGVYPYSVIPGGLKNTDSLRQAAARDNAISRHFAHFNYDKAHLVRVTEPREVYVSYRIRDTIFWTRKKIRLREGELLLTDGKTTARAKCGNQISDTAKPEVSNEEPEEDVLDQPVALEPLGPPFPVRPVLAAADLPTGQPVSPRLYGGGFTFPYVSYGVPLDDVCKFKDGTIDKHCRPHHRRRPVAPEPSTWILIASGMAAILWRYRTTRRPLAA